MDGAIVLDHEARRILRAAVQLLPDASIATSESGTRHRTAERAAKQTGLPVISVSQSMRIVALYVGHQRFVVEEPDAILSRANQALATLERYKARLDEVAGTLSALEIEDLATVRDVCTVVQRLEMVRRISAEISGYVAELGTDGRLVSLQLEELIAGVGPEREFVIRDYVDDRRAHAPDAVLADLTTLAASELIDLTRIATVLAIGGKDGQALDTPVAARGYRLLARVPRLPRDVIDRLILHFGSLQGVLAAGVDDLQAVPGVGAYRARAVREGLARLAESSILERYV
jgi:diadenylate cyclase